MKKTAAILAALLLAAAALCGAAYPSPTSDFFVNDYAGVLSSDTRAYIMEGFTGHDEKSQIVL